MELQKLFNFLNETNDSLFVTRKWNIASYQSDRNYYVKKEIIYHTKVLKSNLSYYIDAYILVRGDIISIAHNIPTQVAFKICALFTKYIIKVDGTTIDDAEDLDLVMPIYNLREYSSS